MTKTKYDIFILIWAIFGAVFFVLNPEIQYLMVYMIICAFLGWYKPDIINYIDSGKLDKKIKEWLSNSKKLS